MNNILTFAEIKNAIFCAKEKRSKKSKKKRKKVLTKVGRYGILTKLTPLRATARG